MKTGVESKEFPSPVLGEGSTHQREGEGRYANVFPLIRALHKGKANLLPEQEKGATIAIILILLSAIIFVAFKFSHNKPCANFNEASLTTPTQTITVALAKKPEQQSKGLGGCTYIPKNAGMLFQFPDAQTQTFWMKDMVIPIDIVWLKDSQVVGIELNAPNQPPGTPDEALPRYSSPVPVDAVLEVGAGKAGEYGIQAGSQLDIDNRGAVRDTSPIL